MKNKKVLIVDSMKDIVIEEQAYFGYHFEKEEKGYISSKLYFTKKNEDPSKDALEKTVNFTHVTSLLPAVIFLLLAVITTTAMFILLKNGVIPFNTQNFLLFFTLPLLVLISIGSFFAIRRTLQVVNFAKDPNKNLKNIYLTFKK